MAQTDAVDLRPIDLVVYGDRTLTIEAAEAILRQQALELVSQTIEDLKANEAARHVIDSDAGIGHRRQARWLELAEACEAAALACIRLDVLRDDPIGTHLVAECQHAIRDAQPVAGVCANPTRYRGRAERMAYAFVCGRWWWERRRVEVAE